MKFLVKRGWSAISFVSFKSQKMQRDVMTECSKLFQIDVFLQYRYKVVHILATYSMSSKSWCVYQVHRLSFCDMSASVPAAFGFWMCKDHPVWTDHGVLDVRNIYNIVTKHQFTFCSFINWVSICCNGNVLTIISVTLIAQDTIFNEYTCQKMDNKEMAKFSFFSLSNFAEYELNAIECPL